VIFSEQKVAQIAAFFLARRQGPMSHMKLMKLMYLADRESMARFDVPMSDDFQCNMRNGPVLSSTLNLMNGFIEHRAWSELISPISNNEVWLMKPIENLEELDELSLSDLSILEHVFQEHGRKRRWDLVDYTHDLPEWVNPGNSSTPIDQTVTFRAFGCSDEDAQEKTRQMQLRKQLGLKLSEMY